MGLPKRLSALQSLKSTDPDAYVQAVLRLSVEVDAHEAREYALRTPPMVMLLVPSEGDMVSLRDRVFPNHRLAVQSPNPEHASGDQAPSALRQMLNVALGLHPETCRTALLTHVASVTPARLPGLHARPNRQWSVPEYLSACTRQGHPWGVDWGRSPSESFMQLYARDTSLEPERFLRGIRADAIFVDEATGLDFDGLRRDLAAAQDRQAERSTRASRAVEASIRRHRDRLNRRARVHWSMRCQRKLHAVADLLRVAAQAGDEAQYQAALRHASVRLCVVRDVALSAGGVTWLSEALVLILDRVRGQFGQSVGFAHLHWPAVFPQGVCLDPLPRATPEPVDSTPGVPHGVHHP